MFEENRFGKILAKYSFLVDLTIIFIANSEQYFIKNK